MAWWTRTRDDAPDGARDDVDSAPLVIVVDLPTSVDEARVPRLVAQWSGGRVVAPGSLVALAPGLQFGGPEVVGSSTRWYVLAARAAASDPLAELDIHADDSVFALVGAIAGLAEAWADRRPVARDELLCGAPAFARALADGLARRLGGAVQIDGGPLTRPETREPTRVVHLSTWISVHDATDVVADVLPGLSVVAGGESDEGWVAAQPGGYGLILAARDAGSRIPVQEDAWSLEADPQLAPLLSGPDQPFSLSVEGPIDETTPEIDVVLDEVARLLAGRLGGVAVDLEGFPVD